MVKFVGSGQGLGRHLMLCVDHEPSLWQDSEAVSEASS